MLYEVITVHADISAEAGVRNILLAVKYRGCSATNCFFPEQKELSLPLEILPAVAASSAEKTAVTEKSPALEKADIPDTKKESASSVITSYSIHYTKLYELFF